MLQGLQLRRAVLQALADHKKKSPETPLKQEQLAKELRVEPDRLEAHFSVLGRAGHITFLHMPGPGGERMRFVEITPEGEKYLRNPKNFETPKGEESPFKVVERGEEKLLTEFPRLRQYVETTEWVLDEEKPEILRKLDELERVLGSDKFNPALIGELKLWFDRHRWLAPHVEAIVKRRFGF